MQLILKEQANFGLFRAVSKIVQTSNSANDLSICFVVRHTRDDNTYSLTGDF